MPAPDSLNRSNPGFQGRADQTTTSYFQADESVATSVELENLSNRAHAGPDSRASAVEQAQPPDPDESEKQDEFEVRWDGDADPLNPRTMSRIRKWIIVSIMASSALCVTCTASLYTFTYGQIEAEFGASREVVTLGLSMFVMGLGLAMIPSPLSEVSHPQSILSTT